jgi:pimeloyl-ACP methyl ester carboxylesterase
MRRIGVREIIIFVHGVSSDEVGRRHDEEYDSLYHGVRAVSSCSSPWANAEICKVEWGWNYDGRPVPQSQRALTRAESILGQRLLKVIDEAYDPTINPGRFVVNSLRPLLVHGFSDMFYYVSSDGKTAIRGALAEQIIDFIDHQHHDSQEPLSLTLLGHSAGSVIAFDFCFYLFAQEDREFVCDPEKGLCNINMRRLRMLAQDGKLRIRRLITFGSPISMVAYRNDVVLDIIAKGGRLSPAWHGLTQNPSAFGPPLKGPRWLNLWDKDDPIAFPVEPLVDNSSRTVRDMYVNVSSNIATAHNLYWDHPDVHSAIAAHW